MTEQEKAAFDAMKHALEIAREHTQVRHNGGNLIKFCRKHGLANSVAARRWVLELACEALSLATNTRSGG